MIERVNSGETFRPSRAGLGYAALGVILFVIGGLALEDSYGGDGLTFVGLLCLALGLVGIIAGGVSLGMNRSD